MKGLLMTNMAIEAGGKNGIMEPDNITLRIYEVKEQKATMNI
jgi:homoaconitase/3-isopropylmalate dehydratase large subunit